MPPHESLADKRILCVHLPHWPIQWRSRRRVRRDRSAIDRLAIVRTVGNRRQVVDASLAAVRQGVSLGMPLAEARLLCPGLACAPHDPAADRRFLEALARWMIRFTPDVAIGWTDDGRDELPGDDLAVLFLDLTGSERLFGPTTGLVQRIAGSLARFGLSAKLAAAPTPGAAWALAMAGEGIGRMVDAHQLLPALAPLPLESLRLESDIVVALRHLGLYTIGQVLELPRQELPARFGSRLSLRLDQALGDRPELLRWLTWGEPIGATIEFDAPIESQESIWLVLERLLDQTLIELARRGVGARQIDLRLLPERHANGSPFERTIPLSRPTRDRRVLLDLLRRATERLESASGFCVFCLDISRHERVHDDQRLLLGDQDAAAQALDRLIERLRVGFGEEVVVRPQFVESHLPERAWRAAEPDWRSSSSSPPPPTSNVASWPVRPTHLLSTPAEIRVVCEPSDERVGRPRQFSHQGRIYRLTHVVGPERIAGEWWRGHHRTRDYYDVEDEQGLRFWIFRVTRRMGETSISTRWFLHGQFA